MHTADWKKGTDNDLMGRGRQTTSNLLRNEGVNREMEIQTHLGVGS